MMADEATTEAGSPSSVGGTGTNRRGSKRWRTACLLFLFLGASSLLATTFLSEDQVEKVQSVLLRQNQVSSLSNSLSGGSSTRSSITSRNDDQTNRNNTVKTNKKKTKKMDKSTNTTGTGAGTMRIRQSSSRQRNSLPPQPDSTTKEASITAAARRAKDKTRVPKLLPTFDNKSISVTNDAPNQATNEGPWPRIAWLMSFPNSGTSYTGQLVKHLTKTKTASNYGEQNLDAQGNSVPIYNASDLLLLHGERNSNNKDKNNNNKHWQGPFYVDPRMTKGFDTPHTYVLTKTHCGGYTTNTAPEKYVEATHSFRRRCLSTKYVQNGIMKRGEYDANLVHKAIHLFRNPFDNVVSRFNFEQKRVQKTTTTSTPHTKTSKSNNINMTKSREGFRTFCQQMDDQWKESERSSIIYEESILRRMERVPCHSDFFRYVEWHNLAFVTTQDLGIDTLVIHYEDYQPETFDKTKQQLVDFLQLPQVGVPRPFQDGKVYSKEYFTKDERQVVREVLQQLALRTTWGFLVRYF